MIKTIFIIISLIVGLSILFTTKEEMEQSDCDPDKVKIITILICLIGIILGLLLIF